MWINLKNTNKRGNFMKRKSRGLMIVLLTVFTILFSFPLTSYADEGKVNLNVKAGFNGNYKVGYYVPIRVEVKNTLKDIEGEVQVEVETGDRSVTIFAKLVNLPINSTKEVYVSIPITKIISKFNIKLVEGKKVIYEEEKTINTGYNPDSFFIGILSDEFDNLNYISSISSIILSNSNNPQNKVIKLNEEIFPDDYNSTRMFDVILVNDFDTSKLNTNQYEALKKWVSNGGTLIIGTGSSYNKTFSIFKDDFLSGKVGEVKRKTTNVLYSIMKNKPNTASMDLSILDVNIQNSTPIIKEENTEIIQKVQKGKGNIIVAAFDFGIEPMSSWIYNSDFVKSLIQRVLPSDYYLGGNLNNMEQNKGINYDFRRALNIIPEIPIPSENKLIAIFFLYIILIAPVNYLILKKKDKREYMWITVPVISLIFVMVMYVSGFSTRISETVVNIVNIIEVNKGGNLNIESYASVVTPNKGDIKIQGGDGMDIEPIFRVQYDRYNGSQTREKIVESKIIIEPKTVVEYYNNSVFQNQIIKLNVDETKKGTLEGKLNYSDGVYKGEVKNNLGFDLEDCHIIIPGGTIKIGNIKKGEIRKIEEASKAYSNKSYNGDIYRLVDEMYESYNIPRKNYAQIKSSNQKRQILLGYFNNRDNKIQPTIFGWSKVPVSKELLANGKAIDKYEKSLVTASIELSYRNGNKIEIPFNNIKPEVEALNGTGHFDINSQWIYDKGEYEIRFDIEKNIKLEDIKLKYVLENSKGNNASNKGVVEYIWNNKTGKWEEGIYQNLHISKESISKYVDNNNSFKLKFEVKQHASVQIPDISIKGSVK